MGNLRASYQEMEAISSSMNSLAEEYSACVEDVYKTIDSLENDWKGNDNVSFINAAKSYQPDLKALGDIITQYATFLSKSAQVVRETQEDIANNASKL